MNSPASAAIMICPKCGRKYQSNPAKPNARYKCPIDQTELTPPGATPPAGEAMPERQSTQRVTQQISPPTVSERITQPIPPPPSASAERTTQPIPPADDQATRVLQHQESDQITRQLNRTTVITDQPAATSDAPTISPTLYEERRSVLAVLQEASGQNPAAALLKDKYEIIGKLGQGGVGEVVKVLDRDLKREVAMKMLLQQEGGISEDSLIRFVEEAQATGQLEHPNIVPVHDLGVDGDGRIYFTLKYVQGSALKKVIKGRSDNAALPDGEGTFREHYSPLRMIEILIAMCQAVAYAHSKGIIHRDLKPDNVMLGKYGEVLVMDWGLAKVLNKSKKSRSESDTVRVSTSRAEGHSDVTMEGSIAGTPAYMSPEQAAGRISELDERTDIYALGAILYEILTGQPPYRGAGAFALVKQVVDGPPPPLPNLTGSAGFHPIPRELRAVCEKAMARKIEDRYASASQLRDDLQAYIEHLPVSAAPDTAVQRAIKWVKRNRRQVQTSAVSAAVVIAIVLGGWFGYQQWTIQRLLGEAKTRLNAARTEYKSAINWTKPRADNNSDAYDAGLYASARAEKEKVFRAGIDEAIEPLHHVLDIAPKNARAKLLLAESYLELWRLAIVDENPELARANRADVERYAPQPSPFAAELNGFGSLKVALDPPDTDAFLFTFEPLRTIDKQGNDLPVRLIPVPYDAAKQKSDKAFIEAERVRIASGKPLPPERHSIFNLDATPASRVGRGTINLQQLRPGSYLLLLQAPGRAEIRVPFKMPRGGSIDRKIVLPHVEELPEGFSYIAGGEVIVGGNTAGAAAPHTLKVGPALYYHDEISMGEYAQFLKSLVKTGHGAEARQRLPKDFGRNLAILNASGELVPPTNTKPEKSDPATFAKSPVRGVSYNDAMAYIAWRTKMDGLPYRLPKDWEWEAACRGADGRTYSWGDQPGKGLAVVTQGYGDTGTNMSWKWDDYKDESPWGIHNLAGGVAEWTMSRYMPNAKQEDPVYAQLAIRGNAWSLPPTGLECAFRTSGQPDYFHPTIGFRIVLDYPVKRIAPPLSTAQAIVHIH